MSLDDFTAGFEFGRACERAALADRAAELDATWHINRRPARTYDQQIADRLADMATAADRWYRASGLDRREWPGGTPAQARATHIW